MPKFDLGDRPQETAPPTKGKKPEVYYPSISIPESLPDGFKVGQNVSGKFNGKVVASEENKDRSSFRIEVHTADIYPTKVTAKDFEDMDEEKQRDYMEEDVEKKGGEK